MAALERGRRTEAPTLLYLAACSSGTRLTTTTGTRRCTARLTMKSTSRWDSVGRVGRPSVCGCSRELPGLLWRGKCALLPGEAEAWEQHGVLEPASAHPASPHTAPHAAPLVTPPLPIRSPTPRCARCCSPSLCPSTSSPTPTGGTRSAAWSCWAYATASPPSSALRTSWRRQRR